MIRIVGVQRSDRVGQEFVLLQNQGSMRARLRGHAVVAEVALEDSEPLRAFHFFAEDADVLPGQYVLLRTCPGEPHTGRTTDGHQIFYAYMNRMTPVWNEARGAVHVLGTLHSHVERNCELLLV